MARYALISDIHGNIDALDAVLRDMDAGPPVDVVLCLGDIIGYCPGVNEVIERLLALERQRPVRYNLGSHDSAALGRYEFIDLASETDAATLRAAGIHDERALVEEYLDADRRRFIPVRAEAREAMRWTIEHLSAESRQFLEQRLEPRIEVEPGIISVHGSPRDPECEYVRDAKFALRVFESREMDGVWLCFVGHTHLPVVWRVLRSQMVSMGSARVCMSLPAADLSARIEMDRSAACYIANVGSIGQPRDADPRAGYARFSLDDGVFEHVRVAYDIETAVGRIRAAGFSERLIERLRSGE